MKDHQRGYCCASSTELHITTHCCTPPSGPHTHTNRLDIRCLTTHTAFPSSSAAARLLLAKVSAGHEPDNELLPAMCHDCCLGQDIINVRWTWMAYCQLGWSRTLSRMAWPWPLEATPHRPYMIAELCVAGCTCPVSNQSPGCMRSLQASELTNARLPSHSLLTSYCIRCAILCGLVQTKFAKSTLA